MLKFKAILKNITCDLIFESNLPIYLNGDH